MAVGETCNCPKCGKRLRWPDVTGVQTVRCPQCGQVFRLQTPAGRDDAPDNGEAALGRPVKAILAALGACGIGLLALLAYVAVRPGRDAQNPPANSAQGTPAGTTAATGKGLTYEEFMAAEPDPHAVANSPPKAPQRLTFEEMMAPPTPGAPPPVQPKALSGEELFAKASPAVVRVVVRDKDFKVIGLGSGFFVSADGLLVTNHHVIDGAQFATVLLANNASLFVEGVAAVDPDADLALLKVNGTGLPFLRVADSAPPKVGAKVFAIGNPRGLTNTLSDGLVSGLRAEGPRGTLIQTTAAISEGSSGGPLLTADGTVVGVTTAYLAKGQNLNLAVPADKVAALIAARGKLQTLASAGGTPLDKEQTDQLDEAWAAMDKKDWAGAAKQLTALRETQKDNPFVWYALAYLHAELGNHDLAVACSKKAIELKPDFHPAYFNMGLAYASMKQHAQAIAAFKAVIAIKPDDAKAYVNMGLTYDTMQRYPEAAAALQAAIAIKPDDAAVHYLIGLVYPKMKKYPEAIAAFKAAIAINPDYADAHHYMGRAYWAMERYPEAIAAFQAAIAISPDNALVHFCLGMTYEAMKQYADAGASFREAARLDPDGDAGRLGKAGAARVDALQRRRR